MQQYESFYRVTIAALLASVIILGLIQNHLLKLLQLVPAYILKVSGNGTNNF